jgi:four helix bundle protein
LLKEQEIHQNWNTPRFLDIAIRSGFECLACLDIAIRSEYVDKINYDELSSQANEIIAMLDGLKKAIKK